MLPVAVAVKTIVYEFVADGEEDGGGHDWLVTPPQDTVQRLTERTPIITSHMDLWA